MKKIINYQSIQKTIDQLVRYYQVPIDTSKKDALNTILSKIDKKEKSKYSVNSKTVFLRVAGLSAAAVAAVVVVVYLFTATIQYNGEFEKSSSFRLPDNSRVVIEKNSGVSIKKYFWNRKVKLDGAAYFEVEKGSKFSVKTETGSVEVLGTRFYVSESDQAMTVQCFEGKVKTQVGDNFYLLTPGNQVENASREEKSEIQPLKNDFPEVAIFNRSYKSTSLNEVASDFNSFFGVNIEMKTKTDPRFTGTIQTGKIENALEIVCTSLQMKYKFTEDNTIQIFK